VRRDPSAQYFCPECQKENKKSSVSIGGSITTEMCVHRYFDENGNYHYHDPNEIKTTYSCSNGHLWVVEHYNYCPTQGCDYPSPKNDLRSMKIETVKMI